MKTIKFKFILGALMFLSQVSLKAQWSLTGNTPSTTNFLGNINNEFLRIRTNNQFRMKINPTINYQVNLLGLQPRDGFTLIGRNTSNGGGTGMIYDNNWGAYSLLHLNGEGTFVEEWGYRNWMRTGITMTGNRDLAYFGLRKLSTNEAEEDITETTISWTDNDGTGGFSSDDLAFRFINGRATGINNVATSDDLDGLHIARFTSNGRIGFGNTFGINATGMTPTVPYVAPQNLLHMSLSENRPVFLQMTNRGTVAADGTGETANDGLYVGIPATTATNQPGLLRNMENDRLEFHTNGVNGERMRIMHTGALNNGVAFPGTLANNFTRIGISHNPATPVTRPLSLLHLGYNTANAVSNDGWRPWMDVGMFVSQASDHVYVGTKPESTGSDAVISWGDNNLPDGAGPDNFRMIFTTPLGVGLGQGNTANGVEGLRMSPTVLQGINTGIGGDPAANPYFGTSINPTATLEVNAWGSSPTTANGATADPAFGGTPTGLSGLRFTDISSNSTPQLNPGPGVLALDGEGDVIYVPANNATGNVLACATAQTDFITKWTSPTEVCNTIMYEDAAIRIGLNTTTPVAKFDVNNDSETLGINVNTTTPRSNTNVGVYSTAENGESNIGVVGTSPRNITFNSTPIIDLPPGSTVAATPINVGVVGFAQDNEFNIGGVFEANQFSNNCVVNIGVYASAKKCTSNPALAGFFRGDILHTGSITSVSDLRFKDNIQSLNNALSVLSGLNPKSYTYNKTKYTELSLPDGKNFGFIAQELEKVLPELVQKAVSPPVVDSKGNIIQDTIQFKTVNYIGLIPIIIAAMQEQQAQIESKDSLLNDLNDKFTKLENCINRLNLCSNGANYRTINPSNTTSETKEDQSNTNSQSVKLSDPQSIVLNQNVPNPFAEKTGISYFLPKSVKSAKILFHNQEGKLINSIEILERGNGSLNVYADDLSSGIYNYTLVADDKVIDTKRMVKN